MPRRRKQSKCRGIFRRGRRTNGNKRRRPFKTTGDHWRTIRRGWRLRGMTSAVSENNEWPKERSRRTRHDQSRRDTLFSSGSLSNMRLKIRTIARLQSHDRSVAGMMSGSSCCQIIGGSVTNSGPCRHGNTMMHLICQYCRNTPKERHRASRHNEVFPSAFCFITTKQKHVMTAERQHDHQQNLERLSLILGC